MLGSKTKVVLDSKLNLGVFRPVILYKECMNVKMLLCKYLSTLAMTCRVKVCILKFNLVILN